MSFSDGMPMLSKLQVPPRNASHFRSDDLDEVKGFVERSVGDHSRVAHRAGAVGLKQAWVAGDAVVAGWVSTEIGMTIRGALGGPVLHVAQPAGAEYRFGRHREVVDACTMMLVTALWEYTLQRPPGVGLALAVSQARLAEESLPDATDVNVSSSIPTLILSGRLDAQTPTFRSEEVKKTLSNARLVVFADGTNVQVGAVNVCAMQTIARLANDPRGELATECLRDHRLPGFLLPDGTVSQR